MHPEDLGKMPLCDRTMATGWVCTRINGHTGPCYLTREARRAPLFRRLACTMFGGHAYESEHRPGLGSLFRFVCTKCHDERLV